MSRPTISEAERVYKRYKNKGWIYITLGIAIMLFELIFLFGKPSIISWVLIVPIMLIFWIGVRNLGMAMTIKRRYLR